MQLDQAIIQLPTSDPRGLQTDASLSVGKNALELRPGLGTPDRGTGVHAFLDWSEGEPVTLDFAYGLRGSQAISLVPRGQETDLSVASTWPHPSFAGRFLPGEGASEVGEEGFKARWSISNLALGQSLMSTEPPGLLVIGSLMLFVALAVVMYATRSIDWSAVGAAPGGPDEPKPSGEDMTGQPA